MIAYDTIKELREQRQWSQEQMAEKLGMSKNGYAKIERGESTPSLERLQQIAQVLGVNIIEFLQLPDKNVVCQISENYSSNYYNANETLQAENERLKLMLAHKDEIIAQKDDYIKLLKRLANIDQNNDCQLIEL